MTKPLDPRLLAAVPGTRALVCATAGTQLLSGLLAISQAVLLAQVIGAQFSHPRPGVTAPLVGLVAAGLCRSAAVSAQEWLVARGAVQVEEQLRSRALAAVFRLGPAWSGQQPRGRLVTATGTGLGAVEGYVTRALPALIAACVVPPLALLAIGLADWQSAAVLVVVLPLIPVFMILIGITTRRRMAEQYAALAGMAGHFLDLVQGITTLKIYGQAHQQRATVERDAERYRVKTMGMLRMAFMSGLVLELAATLGIAVVAVDIGLRLDSGDLTLTRALVVLLLAPELFAPLRAFGAQFHANEAGQAAIGAALDLMDEAVEVPGEASGLSVRFTGGLRVDDLIVSYPGRGERALDRVSLSVASGAVMGIQGRSGAGKSSLLASILGFEGIAGTLARSTGSGWQSLGAIDPATWRAGLAWVPQRPSTTQPTVAREVRLGDPTATPEEVDSVLTLCRTPAGSTPLGEDGRAVSAGERRRVALARAVLRTRAVIVAGQTPLMLLDEPTEDLDEATEDVVIGVISSLAGFATIIIATHSERVLATADRRVVLAAGRLVASTGQRPVRTHLLPAASVTPERSAPDGFVAKPLPLLKNPVRRIIVPALLSGVAGLCGLALTTTSIWLICRAAQHPNVQALALAVVGVRTFALGRALLRYAERLSSHDTALQMLRDVRADVFAALVPLAPGGLDPFRRGDLLRRFVNDVDAVQEGLVRAAIPTAGAVTTAIGASVFAGILYAPAGLVLALGLVLAVVAVPAITRAAAGSGDLAARLAGQRDAQVASALDGQAELAAYGADADALREIATLGLLAGRATRRSSGAASMGSMLAGTTATLTLVAALGLAVQARGLSPVSIGLLTACVLSGFEAVAPLPAAYAAWGRFAAARARVSELIGQRPAMTPGWQPAPTGDLGLCAEGLTVARTTGRGTLLAGVSLSVPAGARIAIMGASGCGKSTLLATAMRLRPIAGGSFAITGGDTSVPLATVTENAVPPVVAGSLQGDHVFNVSLRDNLRVVKPAASDADIDAAAALAGLSSFIDGLPQGWATLAGLDGAALSGGQRQRLLVARALLADPAILVLDEPTAHLDAATERAVLSGLGAKPGRTMLISTHRRLLAGSVETLLRISDGKLRSDEIPLPR